MTDTPASSATCASVARRGPADTVMRAAYRVVYRYTGEGIIRGDTHVGRGRAHRLPARPAHLAGVRRARLVRVPAGGTRTGHHAPARRAAPELLGGRPARRGVRGGQPDRGLHRGAARAHGRAAHPLLVRGRADGC